MILQFLGLKLEVFSVCLLVWIDICGECAGPCLRYWHVVFWTVCPLDRVCLCDVVVPLDPSRVPNGRRPRHGSIYFIEARTSSSLIFTQARSSAISSTRDSLFSTVILWVQLLPLLVRKQIECRIRLNHSFLPPTALVAPILAVSTTSALTFTATSIISTFICTVLTSLISALFAWRFTVLNLIWH